MGKLYLASLRHPNADGSEFLEVRLVHADITDDLSEHEKALIIRDWVEDWHKTNHPDAKLLGINVTTTLDFVAKDRSHKPKRSFNYTLSEVLTEMKHGRPEASQGFINMFIEQLVDYENQSIDQKEVVSRQLTRFQEMFPEIKQNIELARTGLMAQ